MRMMHRVTLMTVFIFSAALHASPARAQVSCTFIDDPLSAGSSIVKAQHITDLRYCIYEMRSYLGLSTAWTNCAVEPTRSRPCCTLTATSMSPTLLATCSAR